MIINQMPAQVSVLKNWVAKALMIGIVWAGVIRHAHQLFTWCNGFVMGNRRIRMYHNPRCSKSSEALALLEQAGVDVDVVHYLEAQLSTQNPQRVAYDVIDGAARSDA